MLETQIKNRARLAVRILFLRESSLPNYRIRSECAEIFVVNAAVLGASGRGSGRRNDTLRRPETAADSQKDRAGA